MSGPRLARWARSAGVFLEMVKVSHSVFALPFALSALFIAARGRPEPLLLLKVAIAVVLARTAAMSFNRWADAEIDRRNPRTSRRAIPAGLLSRGAVAAAALACALLFVLACAWINRVALYLSPLCLAVLLGYSYTKRFTRLSHLVLGLALGLSPIGAWVAAGAPGPLFLAVLSLGGAVLFWVAGFDVIYACQDVEFDRAAGLFSIPARIGIAKALLASRAFHVSAVGLLAAAGFLAGLGWVYWVGVLLVALLLAYEQSLVAPTDLSRVDQAFFTMNGLVSVAFLLAVVLETSVH